MGKPSLYDRAISKLFGGEIERRVKFILTGVDGFYDRGGAVEMRDRFDYRPGGNLAAVPGSLAD